MLKSSRGFFSVLLKASEKRIGHHASLFLTNMEIPVFCYHNALADGLEKDLAFLARNGYETLLASEVVDVLTGARPAPDRAVALTFDDGLSSLETVGLPLFERYGAKATIFAITGLTSEGRTDPTGSGDLFRLLGWDNLRTLQDSGLVEIGSHGHRHNRVHVVAKDGPPVVVADYDRLYDVPVPYTEACDAAAIRAVDGTASRPSLQLLAADKVLVDGELAAAAPLVLEDLRRSTRALRDRLGIERVHLCLPQGGGTEAVPDLAREADMESVFWSRRDDRSENRPGDDPYRIVRRKHDFTRRLPGRGRRSAASVVLTKVRRRLTSDPWV